MGGALERLPEIGARETDERVGAFVHGLPFQVGPAMPAPITAAFLNSRVGIRCISSSPGKEPDAAQKLHRATTACYWSTDRATHAYPLSVSLRSGTIRTALKVITNASVRSTTPMDWS